MNSRLRAAWKKIRRGFKPSKCTLWLRPRLLASYSVIKFYTCLLWWGSFTPGNECRTEIQTCTSFVRWTMVNGRPELSRAAGLKRWATGKYGWGAVNIAPASVALCCGSRLSVGENPGCVLHVHLWISLRLFYVLANAAVSLRDVAGVGKLHKIIRMRDRYKSQIMCKLYTLNKNVP